MWNFMHVGDNYGIIIDKPHKFLQVIAQTRFI